MKDSYGIKELYGGAGRGYGGGGRICLFHYANPFLLLTPYFCKISNTFSAIALCTPMLLNLHSVSS